MNHNPDMTTQGARLTKERTDKGWTQSELGIKAGRLSPGGKAITQSFVAALETGAQENSKYLPYICQALGVSLMWAKTGRGEKMAGAPSSTGTREDKVVPLSERRADYQDAYIREVVAMMNDVPAEARFACLIAVRDTIKTYSATVTPAKSKRGARK